MSVIQASVGRGGINRRGDARTIEFFLNRALPTIYPERFTARQGGNGGSANGASTPGQLAFDPAVILALPADGTVDSATIRVIEDFQRGFCGFQNPDGRIDPHGRTLDLLFAVFLSQSGAVPLSVAEAMSRSVPNARFERTGVPAFERGFFSAGQTIAGFDGRRLILSITAEETIFLLIDHQGPGNEFRALNPLYGRIGTIYLQRTDAFLEERDTMFLRQEAARIERGIQQLQDFQVYMALGVISAIHPGVEAVSTMYRIFRNWALIMALLKFLQKYLEVRRDLNRRAPGLCAKIEAATLKGVQRGSLVAIGVLGDDTFGRLGDAAESPRVIASFAGLIAGTAKTLLSGRLGVLRLVFALLKTVCSGALAVAQRAVLIAVQDKVRTATEIMRHFQQIGVPTTPEQARRIVEEVEAHPREIGNALEDLLQALASLQTSNAQ